MSRSLSNSKNKLKSIVLNTLGPFNYLDYKKIITENVFYDGKGIRKRTKDFELPQQIYGDLSKFPEDLAEYIKTVLKNSTTFDYKGKIKRVGILEGTHLNNIINNIKDKDSHILNNVNKRIAHQIVSMLVNYEPLRSTPLNTVCDYYSKNEFAESFVEGSTLNKFKECIGKTYDERYRRFIHINKYHNLPNYKTKEERLNQLEHHLLEGVDWSSEMKYKKFLELLSRGIFKDKTGLASDIQANDLLENGWYVKDIELLTLRKHLSDFEKRKNWIKSYPSMFS